jgi:dynein heavy chain
VAPSIPSRFWQLDLALTKGSWLLLANCHLMISWLADLEKLIEEKMIEGKPHVDFRMWISSSPSPLFPIGILQRSIKMTTEPPKVRRVATRSVEKAQSPLRKLQVR